MQITDNFNLIEFEIYNPEHGLINPNQIIVASVKNNVIRTANNLQVFRDFIKMPVNISSGYRAPIYNKLVGGAKHSQHLLGKAVDIQVKGLSPKMVYETIEKLIYFGHMEEGGLGLYSTFVHYDCRGNKARWIF